jgi:hypothetical protein
MQNFRPQNLKFYENLENLKFFEIWWNFENFMKIFKSYEIFESLWKFEGKKISSEIQIFRSDQFSLLMYRCLLPSSVTVKMDYEGNMENARYATNNDTPLSVIC